jgi:stage II sporulation protein D
MARRVLAAVILGTLATAGGAASMPLGESTPASSTFAASSSSSALVITGHGWGHGVGMGQWGAYGYALHGWSYERILAHYYSGTTLGTAPTRIVRVLLVDGKQKVALGSGARWTVVDGAGQELTLPAGRLVVPSSLELQGRRLVSPLLLTPGASPVEVGGAAYHGGLLVVSNGKRIQVVNVVDLESYLDGVVGAEVPSTWPRAALEAQAVAARSYALAQVEAAVGSSPFSLYADERSQVYGGIGVETPAVANAVAATAGRVVLYRGKVATTYYSSSTGGQTTAGLDGDGRPIPYLASVPDPYDSLSPYHDWGPVVVSATSAGKALGLGEPLLDLEPAPAPAGHLATLTATGAKGSLTLSGAQVQRDLGLRSTWFDLGWLELAPLDGAVPSGASVTLSGVARGLTGVTLEAKAAGGTWQTVAPVSPDSTGAFAVRVEPRGTTWYRLASGRVRAAVVEVQAGGLVNAKAGAAGVTGAISPPAAGAPLFLDRRDGKSWITVATAIAAADGSFAFRPPLTPGTYRVRCTPGHGLPAGASSVLTITS